MERCFHMLHWIIKYKVARDKLQKIKEQENLTSPPLEVTLFQGSKKKRVKLRRKLKNMFFWAQRNFATERLWANKSICKETKSLCMLHYINDLLKPHDKNPLNHGVHYRGDIAYCTSGLCKLEVVLSPN